MSAGPPAGMQEALARLWTKFLPEMLERVRVLESAATALGAGTLDENARVAATAAAHKLAGVLGTFGLAEGTELAREAEAFYGGCAASEPGAAERMAEIARLLEAMIRTHKWGPPPCGSSDR